MTKKNQTEVIAAGPPITGARKWLLRIVATSFGLGYMPVASGTFGTIPAVVGFWAIMRYAPAELQLWLLGAAVLVCSAACVIIGNWAEPYWGRKDPGRVTIDEMAGYFLTVLLFHPSHMGGFGTETGVGFVRLVAWTFLVTRILDMIKIPPARQLERLRGGWGILLDDLMSSVYAAAVLHAINRFAPQLFEMTFRGFD